MFQHQSKPSTVLTGWCTIAMSVSALQTPRMVEERTSLAARGITQVEVRVARGNVTVRGTSGDQIELRSVRHSSVDDPNKVTIRASHSGAILRVIGVHPPPPAYPIGEPTDYDEELGDFWLHDVAVDIVLSIPTATNVWVRTMSGDLEVTGVAGTVDVATNVGDIRLTGVRNQVRASALGNVDVEWAAFSVPRTLTTRLRADAGNIRIGIPPGESLQIGGRTVVGPPAGEIEIARTEAAGSLTTKVVLGRLTPTEIELNGGSLFVRTSKKR